MKADIRAKPPIYRIADNGEREYLSGSLYSLTDDEINQFNDVCRPLVAIISPEDASVGDYYLYSNFIPSWRIEDVEVRSSNVYFGLRRDIPYVHASSVVDKRAHCDVLRKENYAEFTQLFAHLIYDLDRERADYLEIGEVIFDIREMLNLPVPDRVVRETNFMKELERA